MSPKVCMKIIYPKIPVTNRIKPPKHYVYYEEGGPNQFIISAFKEERIFISARKQTFQVCICFVRFCL